MDESTIDPQHLAMAIIPTTLVGVVSVGILLFQAGALSAPEFCLACMLALATDELTRNKTVVVIAHRLATIEHADQMLVIDEGKVVQQRTHSELVAQPGVYQRFTAIRQAAEGWSI